MTDILYDDRKIKVSYFRDSFEEHSLYSFGNHTLLQRGALEELAKTHPKELETKLNAIDSSFHDFVYRHLESKRRDNRALGPVSIRDMREIYSDVGLALAQARIKELENQVLELLAKLVEDDSLPF